MKIEINEKLDKNFFKEFVNIADNYRNIKKNPNKKVIFNIKKLTNLLIVELFLSIIYIYDYINTQSTFSVVMLVIVVFSIFIWFIYIILVNKRIKDLMKNDVQKSLVEIEETSIKLIREGMNDVEVDWESIDFILINKYTICLVPKKINTLMIALPISKKKEILKEVKDCKKEYLIIDNEKLYL